ncbi:MAG: branched chain amino acid aminotransferase, partial [Acidobacteriota bacterium]
MEKADKIWMNGSLVPWDEARIHVLSHVVHYGSAVFEGIRCYRPSSGSAVFRLKEHVA